MSNRTVVVEKVPKIPRHLAEPLVEFLKNAELNLQPVDFEMGSGAGVFSIRYARENPTRALLSVEKTREKFSKFESRLHHHEDLPNLMPLHANALSVLAHDIGEHSLSRFFLWYPNPFPEKTRFVRTPFFELLLNRIKGGGAFFFASNVEAYFEEMRVFFQSRKDFEIERAESFDVKNRPDFKARTLFEKKYFLRGEKIFDFEVRKLV